MSLVYNETKNKTIELLDIGNGLMYIDPTTQKKNILVKLTDNSYYNIGTRKTETLVGLAKSGGGNQTLNANIIGNPTITEDFIVSGFSKPDSYGNIGDYLILDLAEDYVPTYQIPFEFVIKINIHSYNNNGYVNWVCGVDNDTSNFGIHYSFNEIRGRLSGNGTGQVVSSLNTWVWVKIVNFYNDTPKSQIVYILTSTDGINYKLIASNFGYKKFSKNTPFGWAIIQSSYSNLAFDGEIDMKETYLKIGDEIVWKGVI